jgi:hypothetical protein
MQKWEYKLVRVNPGANEATVTTPGGKEQGVESGLTGLGKDNWELVSVAPSADPYYHWLYFKRPLAG